MKFDPCQSTLAGQGFCHLFILLPTGAAGPRARGAGSEVGRGRGGGGGGGVEGCGGGGH